MGVCVCVGSFVGVLVCSCVAVYTYVRVAAVTAK